MLRLAFISTLCHISVVLNCLSRVLLCVCVCVCARVILYVSVIIIQEQQTVFGASLIHLFHFMRDFFKRDMSLRFATILRTK